MCIRDRPRDTNATFNENFSLYDQIAAVPPGRHFGLLVGVAQGDRCHELPLVGGEAALERRAEAHTLGRGQPAGADALGPGRQQQDVYKRQELSDPKVRRRAADALARRGYRWEDISAGLRRYGAEPEEW